ncbi:MAG: hypothetical protein CMJ80_07315 [Planctomycetaceae bacterium]|nr:hypothetical protein [Planctomycetaceae bacterium]
MVKDVTCDTSNPRSCQKQQTVKFITNWWTFGRRRSATHLQRLTHPINASDAELNHEDQCRNETQRVYADRPPSVREIVLS